MARQPRRQHRSITEMLLETFFGTFRRAVGTFAILFFIFAMVFPDQAAHILNNAIGVLVRTFGPVVPFLVTMAIALWAIRLILKGPAK